MRRDHAYHGPGYRVDANGGHGERPEMISGVFCVLRRDERSALLGDGADPETRWMAYDRDLEELRALETVRP